jgi:hypothetical protein
VRKFKGYPVYYAGEEVLGRPLTGDLGGQPEVAPQERAWVFIYGRCENPPEGEGGCAPFQIHNYSTCSRWANRLNQGTPLRSFRGAKARFSSPEDSVEIFTGRTTITIGGGSDPKLLEAALRQLREVHQPEPSRLPPPAPGSLSGRRPCQWPALRRRAEHRLTAEQVEHQLRTFSDHYSGVSCGIRADDHFSCMATFFNPTSPAKVEIDIKASAKPYRFYAVDCRVRDPEPDTEFACDALMLDLNKAMSG